VDREALELPFMKYETWTGFKKTFLKCQRHDLLALLFVNAWVKIQIEALSLRGW
jgi:hypothetical protein